MHHGLPVNGNKTKERTLCGEAFWVVNIRSPLLAKWMILKRVFKCAFKCQSGAKLALPVKLGSDAVLGEKRCLLTKWIPRSHRKIPQCTPVVCTRAHWGWCCEQQAFCMYRPSIWLRVVSRHTYTYWPNVISSSSGNVRVFMITFLLSSRYNK